MYNGAGKVPPAPLRATVGVEEVVIAGDVVVVVVEVEVMEVVPGGFVVVEVVTAEVVAVGVENTWVVEVGEVVVVEVVVALLQAVKAIAVTSNNDVRTMIHFLLNLFNNSLFSFLLFP